MNEVRRQDIPLPTLDEQIALAIILGRCMHRHTTTLAGSFSSESSCSGCGGTIRFDERKTPVEIAELWLRELSRPASDIGTSAAIGYVLERKGWTVRFLEFDGEIMCDLAKGDARYRSGRHRTRPSAIVEAAAKLARENSSL